MDEKSKKILETEQDINVKESVLTTLKADIKSRQSLLHSLNTQVGASEGYVAKIETLNMQLIDARNRIQELNGM